MVDVLLGSGEKTGGQKVGFNSPTSPSSSRQFISVELISISIIHMKMLALKCVFHRFSNQYPEVKMIGKNVCVTSVQLEQYVHTEKGKVDMV